MSDTGESNRAAGRPEEGEGKGRGRILVVDDEPKMAEAIATSLRRQGHVRVVAPDGAEALRIFQAHGADVVVSDRRMPGMDGVELMRRLREEDSELPVILVTAYGDIPSAVDAMRHGAFDYLTKPFDLEELRGRVARALEMRRLSQENRQLRRHLTDQRAGSIVAQSSSMRRVLELVDRAADSMATVLITGESGTGKEVVARRVHFGSPRRDSPFVAINCKAFSKGVLESELFGHEKGSFTGAEKRRQGCFERADGGTLFLDEIGEIDVDFQAKLLRVLQESEVQPVGAAEPLAVDVRVVAATNRDLRSAIHEGSFREDLFYRLNVIPVHLPPLRDRPVDILPLAERFLARAVRQGGRLLTLGAEAVAALQSHSWPGNVRQLENALERAGVLAQGAEIEAEDLLLHAPDAGPPEQQTGPVSKMEAEAVLPDGSLQDCLDAAAAQRIRLAIEAHGGNRSAAARQLGIDRTTLFRWIKRLGI